MCPMCIHSTKWNASNLWLWSLLGRYRFLNIAHMDIKSLKENFVPVYQYWVFRKFHTSYFLSIRAYFWLVCDRYIPCIETHIALVLSWYCFKSLAGRYWCDGASTVSRHTSLVDCLILRPVSVYTRVRMWYLSKTGYDPLFEQFPRDWKHPVLILSTTQMPWICQTFDH